MFVYNIVVMNYQSLLFISRQLQAGRPTHLEWEDLLLSFESIEGNPRRWRISIMLFQGENRIPPQIQSCVFSSGILRWQTQGPYLKCDAKTHSIYLVQEWENSSSFIAFRKNMKEFLSTAKEWKEILSSFSKQCV